MPVRIIPAQSVRTFGDQRTSVGLELWTGAPMLDRGVVWPLASLETVEEEEEEVLES